MKVLLASYEKAGENQGRLTSFTVSSGIPVRENLKESIKTRDEGYIQKNTISFYRVGETSIDLPVYYSNIYYVDKEGIPGVFSKSKNLSDNSYRNYISPDGYFALPGRLPGLDREYLTASHADGRDDRKLSSTKSSITCKVSFDGEGSLKIGQYTISEDNGKIYWSNE